MFRLKIIKKFKESKREGAALAVVNKTLEDRVASLEREVTKTREQCVVTERRLARETQEVMAFKSQVSICSKLEI